MHCRRSRGRGLAGFAIGATITLDILFGVPLTGAAMNPAEYWSAVAANFWHDHYVYWLDHSSVERWAVLFTVSSSNANLLRALRR